MYIPLEKAESNKHHPEAAKDFMDFLVGEEAGEIYKKFGFDLP
ncbi:substrate-binding domain-containing protein [Pedobacter sp. N36a]|nr:substrate-binding domain-containing protein [Pedobacter sp. N36a]MBC8984538.1 substrate-binding domain-containing protein [Pedobacter sp. N36a]